MGKGAAAEQRLSPAYTPVCAQGKTVTEMLWQVRQVTAARRKCTKSVDVACRQLIKYSEIQNYSRTEKTLP